MEAETCGENELTKAIVLDEINSLSKFSLTTIF
jgi:hypothetical protein